jgi:hypothetical protein
MLDALHEYATTWDLTLNIDTTKIVFRNGGKIKNNE